MLNNKKTTIRTRVPFSSKKAQVGDTILVNQIGTRIPNGFLYRNKKAQVGETVTWFIATIVIVLILMFFTFGASYLAKAKDVLDYSESVLSKALYEGDDIYLKKTIYSQLTAGAQGSFDIGKYIEKKDDKGEFEIQVNTTSKRIRGNFNKK